MNNDSLSDEDLEEILELKQELNEKIKLFNEYATPESLEKAKKYKEKLEKESDIFGENGENLANMNKKQHKETMKKLSRYNKSLDIVNRFNVALQKQVDIDPGRLIGLTDGIFGIVMTLLIFGMTLPETKILSTGEFSSFVVSMIPNVGVTILSFILLASFWISHHQLIKVKSLNLPFLWFNVIFLASLTFIPFTTSMIGTYSNFFLANLIFGLNILLSLILFIEMFKYADKVNLLDYKIKESEKKYTYSTFYIFLVITILVTGLSYFVSEYCVYLLLFIPVISIIRDTNYKLNHALDDD